VLSEARRAIVRWHHDVWDEMAGRRRRDRELGQRSMNLLAHILGVRVTPTPFCRMKKSQVYLRLCLTAISLAGCTKEPTSAPLRLDLPLTDRIIFESYAADTLGDIVTMRIDGTDLVKLTGSSTADFCPALSSDGNWIAFLQRVPEPGQSAYNLVPSMVIMKANGTQQQTLGKYQSLYSGGCPIWSKDSHLVAFASPSSPVTRQPSQSIVQTYDTQGNLVAQFTASEMSNFSFSPDNTRFLYSTHGFSIGPPVDFHLGTVTLAGSDNRGVTPGYRGDWSPDGSEIVYDTCGSSCTDMSTSSPAICVSTPDGAGQQTVATSGRNPIYSPTGDRVAYSCSSNSLCVVPSGGGTITSIPGAGAFILPVWSPDALSVGFVCTSGAQTDICIADLSTGITTNLTNTAANEANLSFSPRSSH
jgi:Tol biopolymer transport system component